MHTGAPSFKLASPEARHIEAPHAARHGRQSCLKTGHAEGNTHRKDWRACARTQGAAWEGSSVDHVDVPGLNVTGASLRSGGCSRGAGLGLNQRLGLHEYALKPTQLSLPPSATVQQCIHFA